LIDKDQRLELLAPTTMGTLQDLQMTDQIVSEQGTAELETAEKGFG